MLSIGFSFIEKSVHQAKLGNQDEEKSKQRWHEL